MQRNGSLPQREKNAALQAEGTGAGRPIPSSQGRCFDLRYRLVE